MCDALDAEFFAECFDKGFIAVSFIAANGMIQVRGDQRITEAMQDMQQRDGIGAAGNPNNNARSFGNKIFPLNRRFDFFNEIHNR